MLKIPQLPHEIIIEIISRLPVKSLMRFKCVSKPWRSLISSPEFAKEHLKQSKQVCNTDCHKICVLADPPLCVDQEAYCDGDEEKLLASQLSLPLSEPITYAEIVGSCDGLICAAFEEEKFILVWNPSTRESRQLPMPNSSASGIAMPRIFYGFGYDLHVDDYKIISGSITPGSNQPKVDAFALKTDEWRRIEDPNCNVVLEGSGAFCNGLLHWLSSQGNNDQQKTYGIVSFDLAQEKFVEMVPLPNQIDQSCLRTDNLIALGNLLCVYCDGPDFEVWAAKEYGTQACCWTRLVRFSSEVLPGYKYWLKFVSITKNGDVVLEFDGWDLVFYNLESGTLKTFTIENEWDICQATLYLESLVSPQCL